MSDLTALRRKMPVRAHFETLSPLCRMVEWQQRRLSDQNEPRPLVALEGRSSQAVSGPEISRRNELQRRLNSPILGCRSMDDCNAGRH